MKFSPLPAKRRIESPGSNVPGLFVRRFLIFSPLIFLVNPKHRLHFLVRYRRSGKTCFPGNSYKGIPLFPRDSRKRPDQHLPVLLVGHLHKPLTIFHPHPPVHTAVHTKNRLTVPLPPDIAKQQLYFSLFDSEQTQQNYQNGHHCAH